MAMYPSAIAPHGASNRHSGCRSSRSNRGSAIACTCCRALERKRGPDLSELPEEPLDIGEVETAVAVEVEDERPARSSAHQSSSAKRSVTSAKSVRPLPLTSSHRPSPSRSAGRPDAARDGRRGCGHVLDQGEAVHVRAVAPEVEGAVRKARRGPRPSASPTTLSGPDCPRSSRLSPARRPRSSRQSSARSRCSGGRRRRTGR